MSKNMTGLDLLVDEYTIPDVMHREGPQATNAPIPGVGVSGSWYQTNTYRNVTIPGQRPAVYQKALNLSLVTGTGAVALAPTQFQVDSILLSVPTGGTSVFLGYGSGVTTASGIEIKAGVPMLIGPDNVREQWELQRALEALIGIIAQANGLASPPPFMSPRVYMDAGQYYLIGTATQTVAVMLFLSPEFQ